MNKVLYVSTYGGFLTDFQIENMKIWKSLGCEIHCAANFCEPQYNRHTEKLNEVCAICHHVDFTRTPYSFSNYKAYKQLYDIIKNEKITILDTHNPVASILSRIAARKCGVEKILYTVHGFFFFKGAPLKNHLLYRPIEYLMARLTDVLIVTNLEDYDVAKKMPVRKRVYYVPGVGVDVDNIIKLKVEKANKRAEFGIAEDTTVFVSIGENIKRKNHETAIRAFAKANLTNAVYIIVGDGILHEYLKNVAKEVDVDNKVVFCGYREDANEILKMSDVYVFPSYQEGLSVALMQAMACELPVIASRIRGNVDCIIDGKGGITVSTENVDEYVIAMKALSENKQLCKQYGFFNFNKVKEFSKSVVKKENYNIFSRIING